METWHFSLLNMLHCLVWLDSPLVLLRNSSSEWKNIISHFGFGDRWDIFGTQLWTTTHTFRLSPHISFSLCSSVTICHQNSLTTV